MSIKSTILFFMVVVSGGASAQDLTIIARQMSSFYADIQSISTTAKSRSDWLEDFVSYRQKAGWSVPAHVTTFSDDSYAARGLMFTADIKSKWGNDAALNDTRYAWDGTHWQSLNRLAAVGPVLELSSKRSGGLEASAHRASIFEMGLPFLLVATPRELPGHLPEDDYQFRVTLDKVRDSRLWDSFARRLVGQIEPVTLAGQACLKFRIDGGVARGDRSTKIFYDIWLPANNPTFPVKHEMRSQVNDILMGRFEVTDFFDNISIVGKKVLGFPKRYRVTFFTDDPAWLNKPYQIDEFELSKCDFNAIISDDEFKIDPGQALRIDLLDTNQTIYVDKEEK